mgnify:CR=1 FL=1
MQGVVLGDIDADAAGGVARSLARFDTVADELGLCRQERRVTMGRVLQLSLPEIAERMKLSLSTVRGYDRSARQRAGCTHGGIGRAHV